MSIAAGILGGTTTMLARNATRKAIQRRSPSRLAAGPPSFRTMLLWAAAAGILLALADVVLEQRRRSSGRGAT